MRRYRLMSKISASGIRSRAKVVTETVLLRINVAFSWASQRPQFRTAEKSNHRLDLQFTDKPGNFVKKYLATAQARKSVWNGYVSSRCSEAESRACGKSANTVSVALPGTAFSYRGKRRPSDVVRSRQFYSSDSLPKNRDTISQPGIFHPHLGMEAVYTTFSNC